MQSVGKPDIDVNRHRTCTNRADGFLANWHRVLFQRLPKTIVELDLILPERGLGFVDDTRERDRVLDEGPIAAMFGATGEIG